MIFQVIIKYLFLAIDISSKIGNTLMNSITLCFGFSEEDLIKADNYFLKDRLSNNGGKNNLIEEKTKNCKNCVIF